MKKLLLLLSAIVVFACFVSCGNKEEPSEQIPEEYDFVFVWNISNQYDSVKETISTDLGSDSISSSGKKYTTTYKLTKEQKEEIRNILNTVDLSKLSGKLETRDDIFISDNFPNFRLTVVSDSFSTNIWGEVWLSDYQTPEYTGWSEDYEGNKLLEACSQIAKILYSTDAYKGLEMP